MPGTNRKVEVVLEERTRQELESLARSGVAPARKVRNARILLMADEDRREGRRPDWYIAECLGISERQVCRVRQQFARDGLGATLVRKRRSDAEIPRKLDGQVEAQLVTLCCSTPPAGRERWTLQLLVDELCRLNVVASVCKESVRQCLKKTGSSPGKRRGFASRRPIGRGSSRSSNRCSTSTTNASTSGIP